MLPPRFVVLAISVLALAVPTTATAHIQMSEPAARELNQKSGPCGSSGSIRGSNITTYAPGQTITVRWAETVNHPGHYRISFDEDGQDDLLDPGGFMDFYSNPTVLLDEIADKDGGMYEATVTLPDVQCDNCTLQLIQMMYDKGPQYGDNDVYYQCADIELMDGGTPDTGPVDMGGTDMAVSTDMGVTDMAVSTDTGGTDTGGTDTGSGSDTSSDGGDTSAAEMDSSSGDDGCGCTLRTSGRGSWPMPLAVLGVMGLVALVRRRR